jgi:pyrimidine nucleoside transport protein
LNSAAAVYEPKLLIIFHSTDTSIIDAASNGANQAINLMLCIIANLVAFVAVVAFFDSLLTWLTTLAGFEMVNLQFILGKICMPISWLIGVEWKDCEAVGYIIGTKTIINEFVAFKLLGDYKANGTISVSNGGDLIKDIFSKFCFQDRSSAIATYAITSFANPATIGIMIGALSSLAPERRPSVTKVALRAFVAACFVTLCTASIAGLLMTDEMISGNHTRFND